VSASERLVRGVSIDSVVDLERRRAMLDADALNEIDHQFQLPISGVATSTMAWVTKTVEFDVEFVFAPEQRDSALTMPHFTYGAVARAEVDTTIEGANPSGALAISAVVLDWVTDTRRNVITGAQVAVGVMFSGNTTPQFHGTVHLTFQGFGALAENDEVLDVGT
jgi:hypothetical protein